MAYKYLVSITDKENRKELFPQVTEEGKIILNINDMDGEGSDFVQITIDDWHVLQLYIENELRPFIAESKKEAMLHIQKNEGNE